MPLSSIGSCDICTTKAVAHMAYDSLSNLCLLKKIIGFFRHVRQFVCTHLSVDHQIDQTLISAFCPNLFRGLSSSVCLATCLSIIMFEKYKSAYIKGHSMETVLPKIIIYLLLSVDN